MLFPSVLIRDVFVSSLSLSVTLLAL